MTTSPNDPLRLAVVTGSTREGRFCPTVSDWFIGLAKQREDFTVDAIDLADYDIHSVYGSEGGAALAGFSERIAAADAIIVVTPEYNHSYPAALKQAIDFLREEWNAKAVGFVSYGGVSGGLRAVEHLRTVFAELHAVTIRDSISLHSAWSLFDDDGNHLDPEPAAGAVKKVLDQLAWWAAALRTARREHPYAA